MADTISTSSNPNASWEYVHFFFFFFFFRFFFEFFLSRRTFQLSVSFTPAVGEETRLHALKESVNALRNNVIELRAKKMFLSSIKGKF